MTYTPRYVIYFAVCKYLDAATKEKLRLAIGKNEKITDATFIKIIEQYFDFTLMRDKPLRKEDVWLYNYLMYENKKKDGYHILEIGNSIRFKGRLLRKGLVAKYEREVLPGGLMVDSYLLS